ncbi:MAG: segregation/condensation protein A [Oscillospiraceae bacterium]
MTALNFKLEVFEGPLDLLLHLISKHKLNINDIPITILLQQYIEYISQMELADMEVQSEFLAMAARLVYIKTVSLLPKISEAQELKRELEGQLLEYKLAKQIAKQMELLSRMGDIFTRKPAIVEIDKTYTRKHSPVELLDAYVMAIGKAKRNLPPPKTAFSGIVSRRMVSVESRIVFVLQKLYKFGEVAYDDFFNPLKNLDDVYEVDRSELVATFLAMLELIKCNKIKINDDNTYVFFNKEYKTNEGISISNYD